MCTAAELGDYDEDADVTSAIQAMQLLPEYAVEHTDDIIDEYKTLRYSTLSSALFERLSLRLLVIFTFSSLI